MAEFVGGEPISVGVDEPITFENKTHTGFDVGYGIIFRKSGLYRVSIDGRHVSVAVEQERKKGKWILTEKGAVVSLYECSICGRSIINDTGYVVYKDYPFCHCGADMRGGDE